MVLVTTARTMMRPASSWMRRGSSKTMPLGGSGNDGLVGLRAWQVTQRRSMMACASANETGAAPARSGPAGAALGTCAVSAITATRAASPPASTHRLLRPRKFITYLAATPNSMSSVSTNQARGWP